MVYWSLLFGFAKKSVDSLVCLSQSRALIHLYSLKWNRRLLVVWAVIAVHETLNCRCAKFKPKASMHSLLNFCVNGTGQSLNLTSIVSIEVHCDSRHGLPFQYMMYRAPLWTFEAWKNKSFIVESGELPFFEFKLKFAIVN